MPAENLLLLPGMMCDARLWEPQVQALDIPTFIGDLTTSDNLEEIGASVLENAPSSFAVAGLSMGGIVALELWRQAPERITHLALLDTNAKADTPDRRSTRLDQVQQVLAGQLRSLAMETLKPAYLAKANRDNKELLDVILAMAVDAGEATFERQSLALKDRPDSVAMLKTIDCPTLVMCGAEDRICPVSLHELMASRIPGARLVIIDDCGHLASLERPDIVNQELQLLLQR